MRGTLDRKLSQIARLAVGVGSWRLKWWRGCGGRDVNVIEESQALNFLSLMGNFDMGVWEA